MTYTLLLAAFLGTSAPAAQDWLEVVVRTVDASLITAHDGLTGLLVTRTSGGPSGTPELSGVRVRGHVLSVTRGNESGYQWERLELQASSEESEKLEKDLPEATIEGSWMRAFIDASKPPRTCSHKIQYNVVTPNGGAFILRAVPCSVEQAARIGSYFESLRANRHFLQVGADSHGPPRSLRTTEWEQLAIGTLAAAVAKRFGPPDQVWRSWPDGFVWLYPAHKSAAASAVAITFDRARRIQAVRPLSGERWAQ